METTVIVAVVVVLIIFFIGRRVLIMHNSNVENVSASEAHNLICENKDMVILDVRTKEEYDMGHISGAILIPVHELSTRVNELNTYNNKPVLVYCASGGRSPQAVHTLLSNNFTQIYHLHSGILSWEYGLQIS